MNVIIIDDEELARENLSGILNEHFPSLNVIGEADSVDSGIDLLTHKKVDLVFLDINLFDGSGFTILQSLKNVDFQVVFVTAYNDFAIQAFRVNALDYILKPINIDELGQAVAKAIANFENKATNWINESVNNGFENQRLAIKENHGIRFVDITDIAYCKADSNYSEIYLKSGERILSSRTLKEYAEILENYDFYRIHHSHIINLSIVKRIIKQDGIFVELMEGKILEVSRRRKVGLMLKLSLVN